MKPSVRLECIPKKHDYNDGSWYWESRCEALTQLGRPCECDRLKDSLDGEWCGYHDPIRRTARRDKVVNRKARAWDSLYEYLPRAFVERVWKAAKE